MANESNTDHRHLKVRLIEVRHSKDAKENVEWHFAKAELPNIYPGAVWSTMRLTCTTKDEPFPSDWKEGNEVLVAVRKFDVVAGDGSFRPL